MQVYNTDNKKTLDRSITINDLITRIRKPEAKREQPSNGVWNPSKPISQYKNPFCNLLWIF